MSRPTSRDKSSVGVGSRCLLNAGRSAGGDVTADEPGWSLARATGMAPAPVHLDEVLLRALFDEHATALLSYSVRLTGGDRGWAEDVVQETLLRAWQHPRAFDVSRGPARPWLYTVARNLVMDGRRARRARPAEVDEAVLALLPSGDDIERAVETWEVADALAALSPDHRAVLIETHYRGCSVAQAAIVLGVPEGTVKSRTYYALRALRLELQERGVTL